MAWEMADGAALTAPEWAIKNAVAIGQNRGFMWFSEMDFIAFASIMEDQSGE